MMLRVFIMSGIHPFQGSQMTSLTLVVCTPISSHQTKKKKACDINAFGAIC